jgi:hypothetical protein
MGSDQPGLLYWSEVSSTGYLQWPQGTKPPRVGELVRFRGRVFQVLEVLARRSTDITPVMHVKITRMINHNPTC